MCVGFLVLSQFFQIHSRICKLGTRGWSHCSTSKTIMTRLLGKKRYYSFKSIPICSNSSIANYLELLRWASLPLHWAELAVILARVSLVVKTQRGRGYINLETPYLNSNRSFPYVPAYYTNLRQVFWIFLALGVASSIVIGQEAAQPLTNVLQDTGGLGIPLAQTSGK